MRRHAIVLLVSLLVAAMAPSASIASSADPTGGGDGAGGSASAAPYAPGVVLVGFEPGVAANQRAQAHRDARAVAVEPLSELAGDAQLLRLAPGRSVEEAIGALERNPNVRYAEPDYVLTSSQTIGAPNDPYLDDLWGMQSDESTPSNTYGSAAVDAWESGFTGSGEAYVVVIDTGLQPGHPDLEANVAADLGRNFIDDSTSYYAGSEDDHGTHVAGTIGAVGDNGTGVVGVNWDVSMISTKFLGPDGGSTSDAVKALDYATQLKTRSLDPLNIVATNNSWGGGVYSQSLLDAINRGGDADILFVAAAGNGQSPPFYLGRDIDDSPSYPAAYECTTTATGLARGWDCIVSVAAITSTGSLASFSHYGERSVDLGAPGDAILSTVAESGYAQKSGTSMAAPHVTGALALCASIDATHDAQGLRSLLLDSLTPTSSLDGTTATGGRLDVGAMAASCAGAAETLRIGTRDLPDAVVGTEYVVDLEAGGGDGSYTWGIETGAPAWLSIDPGTGQLIGTPGDEDVSESTSVTVSVADGDGATASKQFEFAVVEPLTVAGLDVTTTGNKWRRGQATVDIAQGTEPAPGVTVAGTWRFDGEDVASATGVTDDAGRVVVDSGNQRLEGGDYDFCVTSLSGPQYVATSFGATGICSADVDTGDGDGSDGDGSGGDGSGGDGGGDGDPSAVELTGSANKSGRNWSATLTVTALDSVENLTVAWESTEGQTGDAGGNCSSLSKDETCSVDSDLLPNQDGSVTYTVTWGDSASPEDDSLIVTR